MRLRENWAAIRTAWETREDDGVSIGQIARAFGVDKAAVVRRARLEGWDRPAPRQRYEPASQRMPANTAMRRCECGALYRATITKDGVSPHCDRRAGYARTGA